MVSYLKNTDKLKELFIESRDPQAMRAMFDITFKGRRFEVTNGDFNGVEEVVQKRCPLLRQPLFVGHRPFLFK